MPAPPTANGVPLPLDAAESVALLCDLVAVASTTARALAALAAARKGPLRELAGDLVAAADQLASWLPRLLEAQAALSVTPNEEER